MWEDVRRCEKMWEDVRRCEKMWEDVRRCEKDVRRCEKMWEDVRRCEKMWEGVRRWEKDVRRCEKMCKRARGEDVRRCEKDARRCEKMRRCFIDPHYWKNPALRRSREKKTNQYHACTAFLEKSLENALGGGLGTLWGSWLDSLPWKSFWGIFFLNLPQESSTPL